MIPGVVASQRRSDLDDEEAEEGVPVFWNPADKHAAITLSGDNLVAETTATNLYRGVRANVGYSSGRYYVECRVLAMSNADEMAPIGLAELGAPLDDYMGSGASDESFGYFANGTVWNSGSGGGSGGLEVAVLETAGIYIDFDEQRVYPRSNEGWGFADPLTSSNGFDFTGTHTYYPACTLYGLGDEVELNGGGDPFFHDVSDASLPPFTYAWNGVLLVPGPIVTWNPSDKSADITLSGSNLVATQTGGAGNFRNVRGTFGFASLHSWTGKRYFECRRNAATDPADLMVIGFGTGSTSLSQRLGTQGGGQLSAALAANGDIYAAATGFTPTGSLGDSIDTNEWAGCAIDFTAGKAWFRGPAGFDGDPVGGTGQALSWTPGVTITMAAKLFPMCGGGEVSDQVMANFGSSAFAYALPAGYEPWSDQ